MYKNQHERAIENLRFYHSWLGMSLKERVFSKRLSVLKESGRTKMWTREQPLFLGRQSLFFKPPCKHSNFHITSTIIERAGTSLCSAAKYNVLV